MKQFIKKYWFRLVLTLLIFGLHTMVYWITPVFIPQQKIEMPSFMVTIFDKVPLVPFFIIFYFGCFIWWIITFETATKKRVYEIVFVAIIGYIFIAISFIVFPVAINRDLSPVTGNDIFSKAVIFLRQIDDSGKLFPSVHVFVSALAYLSVSFDKNKKLWVRIVNFSWLILVWASTLFLKQHYFVDGLAATILAVVLLLIIRKTKLTDWLINLEDKLNLKIEEKRRNKSKKQD